jgi:hypothetical protein
MSQGSYLMAKFWIYVYRRFFGLLSRLRKSITFTGFFRLVQIHKMLGGDSHKTIAIGLFVAPLQRFRGCSLNVI